MMKRVRLMGVCAWMIIQCAHAQHLNVKSSDFLDAIPPVQRIPGLEAPVSTTPVSDDLLKMLNLESDVCLEVSELSFANTDSKGTIIDDFGSKLYSGDLKFVKPQIRYAGLGSEKKDVLFRIRVLSPEGNLLVGQHSTEGFTYETVGTVMPGKDNVLSLSGWGHNKEMPYSPGRYQYEVWQGNSRLFAKSFTVYPGKHPLESSKKVKIQGVEFFGKDGDGQIVRGEARRLPARRMYFLYGDLSFEGMVSQDVQMNIRIFDPKGYLCQIEEASTGFTSDDMTIPVRKGTNQFLLTGIGRAKKAYEAGTYIYEIWSEGKKIYETTLEME